MSPSFGGVAADFFGDGLPSLACVQNLYSREPETGLWRGGLGCILRPTADDAPVATIGNDLTGFVVAGDGKALAVADLNNDGRPDLVASQNNDAISAFLSHPNSASEPICVRLVGPPVPPNPLDDKKITEMKFRG